MNDKHSPQVTSTPPPQDIAATVPGSYFDLGDMAYQMCMKPEEDDAEAQEKQSSLGG